jgi:hypothetical protein
MCKLTVLVRKLVPPPDYVPKDRKDFLDPYLCFRDTVVDAEEAVMVVDSVGINTCFGELHLELANASDNRPSPLQGNSSCESMR